jgi:hypothetical protein
MKKYILLLGIALIGTMVIILFFYHFGHHDSVALTDFSIAYTNYDKAEANYSTAVKASSINDTISTDAFEYKANQSLTELNQKASARISSLTRYDPELMSLMQEIATLSGKELNTLDAYRTAITDKDASLDGLAKELSDLTALRQAAYARFRELSGL